MIARWFLRLSPMMALVVLATRSARADCVIGGVRPTVPLPTMESGQDFVFVATADCEMLRFRVPGTRFIKTPKPGPDTGSKDRTYKVALTESEWNELVDEGDSTFRWSIIGTTSAGVATRVTTTNALNGAEIPIDLALADAKLVGEKAGDNAGYSVSGAGDVDGDGNDDLLVGAWFADDGFTGAGAAYVVRGPVTGTLDLSRADAKLVGEGSLDYAGYSVSGAGDVDGDGNDDLLVGATYNRAGGLYAGAAYLVLGPVSGTLGLFRADAKLVGENAYDQAGFSVSGAGDVDGDGDDDLLVGALYNREGGLYAGAAYLVLGPVSGALDLSRADAKLVGEERLDLAGASVSGAGDVDADGHDDLLVGSVENDQGGDHAGAAYLALGPLTGTLDLSLADAKLVGEKRVDFAGASVSGAGDVDRDGHDDLLVGASWKDAGGENAGAAYLVLGPVTGTFDLSLADAKLVGEDAYDYAGSSVSGAGDLDGDGNDDLLIGTRINDTRRHHANAAYVVLGPVTGTLDLSLADAKLVGEAVDDSAGSSVSGAGDVDGDGRDDLLVGAYRNDQGSEDAGAAYLVYGGGLF